MLGLLQTNPLAFFLIFPGLLLAITVHEFAHAFVADKLGDPTPRHHGRITLDPRAHLDPLGVVMILLTRFGWGKPVQFDPYNLKDPVRDTALIALAGPLSNIIFAALISVVLNFNLVPVEWIAVGLFQIMVINVVLAIFNLVPVYPLDGSKVFASLLPSNMAYEYENFMSRYGMYLLIALIIPWNGVSPVSSLIWPVISFVINLLLF